LLEGVFNKLHCLIERMHHGHGVPRHPSLISAQQIHVETNTQYSIKIIKNISI